METVSLSWQQLNQVEYLHFSFINFFTKKDAQDASLEWESHFNNRTQSKYHIVFDCTYMTDYDPQARIVWQKTIIKLKEQIGTIWVITSSRTLTAAAAMLGIFTSFKIKVVPNIDAVALS